MELKGIIFDFDGTLMDTLPVCIIAYRKAFERFVHKEYDDEEICAFFGPSEEGIIKKVVPEKTEECLDQYLAEYALAHENCQEFAEISATLIWLKEQDVKIAIVSGKGARSMKISLEQANFGDVFDYVETGSALGANKPDGILRIMHKWSLEPQQVAYIGDAPYDMIAAREAGVIPLGAAWAPGCDGGTLSRMGATAIFYSVAAFRMWLTDALGLPH